MTLSITVNVISIYLGGVLLFLVGYLRWFGCILGDIKGDKLRSYL